MRIIVWGINYSPELTGIAPFNAGLCEHLAEHGHQVEMVTAFPYYPFWKKIPDDHGRLFHTDRFETVLVHRCWHYVPEKPTPLRRIWHELSFALTSFVRVLFLARPDLYIVISPPLLLGPLASLAARLKSRRYLFHVQDLQPDAAVGLGMVEPGIFTRLLYRIEAWAYRDARLVSGISAGMMNAFTRKGVPPAKQVYFPNWLRSVARNVEYVAAPEPREPERRAFRAKHGFAADTFVASYSGNLGRKQGLETLVAAAALLEERARQASGAARDIAIVIVGDGALRQSLETQIAALRLQRVRLLPLLIERDYRQLLTGSDVCLVTQAPKTGQFFFPSKLLSILAAGTPVLSVADDDSELARAVREGGFGVNVLPGDPGAIADQLGRLAEAPAALDRMRAGTAWVKQFSASRVLDAYEKKIAEAVELDHPPAQGR